MVLIVVFLFVPVELEAPELPSDDPSLGFFRSFGLFFVDPSSNFETSFRDSDDNLSILGFSILTNTKHSTVLNRTMHSTILHKASNTSFMSEFYGGN